MSGGLGGGGTIPSGLTQSPLMEPGVERARTRQHYLEMRLELLGASGFDAAASGVQQR